MRINNPILTILTCLVLSAVLILTNHLWDTQVATAIGISSTIVQEGRFNPIQEEEEGEYEEEDESSSSSEEEIVYVRKKAPQRKRAPKSKVNFATDNSIDDIYNQRMQHAFGSLFPQF